MNGRWTVEPATNGEDGNPLWYYINDENGEPIASTWSGNEYARERALDNARLMAAAPDLYVALLLAKDMMIANDCSLPKTFEVIDAAIATAAGGES